MSSYARPARDEPGEVDDDLVDVLDDPAVRDLLDDRPETLELRPAMRELTTSQRELLAEFIDGFDDRRDLLEWGLRAIVHTLGEFDPEWISEALTSKADLAVLVDGYPAPDGADIGVERATRMRGSLVVLDFFPACWRAQRRLRWKSREWSPGEYEGGLPDGEEQRHPGMMPALTEISDRLTWSLTTFLDGFGSRNALLMWYSETIEGSFVTLDGSVVEEAVLDRPSLGREFLIVGRSGEDDDPMGSEIRIGLAADELLPAAADAVDARIEHANEFVETEQETDNRPAL